LFDLFPTLCDLTELEIPKTVEGKSFAALVSGTKKEHRKDIVFGYKEFQRAYRKANYKLIEYYVKTERNTQLFDLEKDPGEFNNLYGNKEFISVYEELKTDLLQQMKSLNDTNEIYKALIIN